MKSHHILNLKEVCRQLHITEASGRNWLKLGKLTPDLFDGKHPLFYQSKIDLLSKEIASGKNKALKSRRNKIHLGGSRLYEAYLSNDSKNIRSIRSLFQEIQTLKDRLKEQEILYLVADAAQKLYAEIGATVSPKSKLQEEGWTSLIRDLVDDPKKHSDFMRRNPQLFSYPFVYEPGEDILGMIYLSLTNLSSRKTTGAYYTPKSVVKKLLESLQEFAEPDCTWLDPCCGTGNFLLQLPGDVDLTKIHAMDIDANAVLILRINLALKYRCFDYELLGKNCVVGDFLMRTPPFDCDIIIGNPPWGYAFSEEQLRLLKETFGKKTQKGRIESYDLFLEQAISNLKEGGALSFVLPEALLNVKSHRSTRNLILKRMRFKYLEYLGNAFSQVHCPAIILTLEKSRDPSCIGMKVKTGRKTFRILRDREYDCGAFNFDLDDEEYNVLMKIKHLRHRTFLKDRSDFALGIVTGDNESYLSSEKTPLNEPVVKGSDIFKYGRLRPERYLEFKPEGFQQMAPMQHYRASQKLFYRFICNQPVFVYDDRGLLSLNSCNILIPKAEDLHIKYILSVLNSRVVQFYFQKSFHSVKVLRSHIESIPIPLISWKKQEEFISLADEIMRLTDPDKRLALYDKTDTKIAKLFRLSKKEYEVILSHVKAQNLFLNEM